MTTQFSKSGAEPPPLFFDNGISGVGGILPSAGDPQAIETIKGRLNGK